MKKLLLLLILSFFSPQGFAGSCPDGSEPIKSVSEDGTYFVFNCGGGNEQSSPTNTGSWNDPGPLDKLTIPDNWQLVKDRKAFEKARFVFKAHTPKMLGLDENACLSRVKDWRNSMKLLTSGAGKKQKDESSAYGSDSSKIGADIQDCLDKLIYTTQSYTGTPNYMKEILLHWAKTAACLLYTSQSPRD